MACQTFFFSSSRKNRPQRMVYYRFTNTERGQHAHGGLVLGRSQVPAQAGWRTPQLTCGIPPSRAQPIPDRSVHPATRTATPPPPATTRSLTGVGGLLPTEPVRGAVVPVTTSVACRITNQWLSTRTQCCHGVTVYLHDYRHTYDKKRSTFFPKQQQQMITIGKGKIK